MGFIGGSGMEVDYPFCFGDVTSVNVYGIDSTPAGVRSGRAGLRTISTQHLMDFLPVSSFSGSADYAIFNFGIRLITPSSEVQATSVTIHIGAPTAGGTHWILRIATSNTIPNITNLKLYRSDDAATVVDSKAPGIVTWMWLGFKITLAAGANQYDCEWFYDHASEGSHAAGNVDTCTEDLEFIMAAKPGKGNDLGWAIDDIIVMDDTGDILNDELATTYGYVPYQPNGDVTTDWADCGEAHAFRCVDDFNESEEEQEGWPNEITLASGSTGTEKFDFPTVEGDTPLYVAINEISLLSSGDEPDKVIHQVAGESSYTETWDIDGIDARSSGVVECSVKGLITTGDGNPWTEARLAALAAGFVKDTTGTGESVSAFGLEVLGDGLTTPPKNQPYVPGYAYSRAVII